MPEAIGADELFGSHCQVLAAGRAAMQEKLAGRSPGMAALREDLEKPEHSAYPKYIKQWVRLKHLEQSAAKSLNRNSAARPLFSARCRLVSCLLEDLPADKIVAEVEQVFVTIAKEWNWKTCSAFERQQPQFTNSSPSQFPGVAADLRNHLDSLALKFGAWHPAWNFVRESIGYLHRKADRWDCDHEVVAWVMLAETGTGRPVPPSRLFLGRLAKLTIERVPQGCGAIYPHPALHGYLTMDAAFSAMLQHAVLGALSLRQEVRGFDYRWRLETLGEPPVPASLLGVAGPSAGPPFAASLVAAALGEKLDLHVASTGMFRRPEDGDFSLEPVGLVSRKTSAQQLHEQLVREVVVAHGQQVEGVDKVVERKEPNHWNFALVPVENLSDAYERLAKFPRITKAVKEYMAARSKRLLEFLCKPYVRPSICRVKEDRDERPAAETDRYERDRYERVDDQELALLFAGTPRDQRIRLFADSGFGKSTLLVELEGTIARSSGTMVPVRVGAGFADVSRDAKEHPRLPLLDNQLFVGTQDEVLVKLASRLNWVAHADLTTRARSVSKDDLRDWLRRKVEYGEVVFLFDAADQTGDHPMGVANLLKDCSNCTAVISGRPETKNTKEHLWGLEADRWTTFYSRGFDQPEWTAYFTADADKDNREGLRQRAESIWNSANWQPLVRLPILAEQVKALDRAGELLDEMRLYDLYTASLHRLINKGMETLNSTRETRHRDELWSVDEVLRKILAPLAWTMLQVELSESECGGFTGQVEGAAFSRLKETRSSELQGITFPTLWQLGVTTRMAILDRDGRERHGSTSFSGGLGWRHLAFYEYFIGRALADRPHEFATLAERHGREPQWRWIFRFALSRLAELRRREELNALARSLIQFGNPFVVYEAIAEDRIELSQELDELCRWLVHRDGDTQDAWKSASPPPVSSAVVEFLATAMKFEYRDSRYLHAAWELVEQAADVSTTEHGIRVAAATIRQEFLAEYPRRLQAGDAVAKRLAASFVRCPPRDKRAPEDADGRPFVQGTPGDTGNEFPREVVVSPFELMDFVVTNEQFEILSPRHPRNAYNQDDDQPVTDVTWYEAKMFALFVGADLPTEAQWEYAARAGAGTKLCRIADPKSPWGYRDLDHESDLALVANWGDRIGKTTPRGMFQPNWWGLYDMLGNVWEWCRDRYSETYYRELSSGVVTDPQGPSEGPFRSYRGGCWGYYAPMHFRAAKRFRREPGCRGSYFGFRLALVRSAELS